MPKIILKFEAAVIKEYPMTSSTLTIGRQADNDIYIDHPAVSRHHCRILLQGNIYFIEDLNSTNGTLHNDKKVIKAGLRDQDVIAIAKHNLIFVDDRPAVENKSEAPSDPAITPPASDLPPTPLTPPLAAKNLEVPEVSPPVNKGFEKMGGLRVIEGVVDQMDYQLTENSTYIGKSDRVHIKIKGMFAPEVAGMISKKQTGYSLVAIKDGYPKINGMPVQGERALNEGDVIEVGGTQLQFYLKNK